MGSVGVVAGWALVPTKASWNEPTRCPSTTGSRAGPASRGVAGAAVFGSPRWPAVRVRHEVDERLPADQQSQQAGPVRRA